MVRVPRVAVLLSALALMVQPVVAHLCESSCLPSIAVPDSGETSCHHAIESTDTLTQSSDGGSSLRSTTHACGHGLIAEPVRSLLRVRDLPRAVLTIEIGTPIAAATTESSWRPPHSPPDFLVLRPTVLRV